MISRSLSLTTALCLVLGAATAAQSQTLWVTGENGAAAYDIASGVQKAAFDIAGKTSDMHALPNGFVVVNHRAEAQLILLDAGTLTEAGRMPSSTLGGINPHHAYVLRTGNADLYVVMHDGDDPEQNSTVSLFRVTDTAPGLVHAGEIRVGNGHHKLAHHPGQNWISVSNINDCDNLVQVIDITDPANPATIRKISAGDIGYDASSADKTCDATGEAGRKLSPHGAGATSTYHAHNLTRSGQMLVIRADGSAQTVETGGTGGASAVSRGDRLYLTQFSPRAGVADGAACQVGQITVLDAEAALAAQVPMLKAPGCDADAQGARLGYVSLSDDGKTLLLPLGTLGSDAQPNDVIARAELTEAGLVQLPSIQAADNLGHRDHGWNGTLSAFPNNQANTVSVVDNVAGTVVASVPVLDTPSRVAITRP